LKTPVSIAPDALEAEADLVVTEYGIAELRGRTLAERARALIAVADPSFRSELMGASEPLF